MGSLFVNQAQIARAAGLSKAAVSYALRGHARIPEATQRRVWAIAKKLGYQPDPAFSRIMSYLRGAGRARTLTKVAVLIPGRTEAEAKEDIRIQEMLRGVTRESHRHGVVVEFFWPKGVPGMTPAKLNRMIRARGFSGIIIGPMSRGDDTLDFDFSGLACAAMGYSLRTPLLNRAGPNHFRAMRGLLEAIRRSGIRRIGAILHRRHEDGSNNLLSSAVRLAQSDLPASARLSILVTDDESVATKDLRRYLDKERPELLLGVGPLHAKLRQLGYRVPEDIAFASIDCGQPPHEAAGLELGYELVGAAAANLVATQLSLGSSGLPRDPQVLMVNSTWKWGPTLPPPAAG